MINHEQQYNLHEARTCFKQADFPFPWKQNLLNTKFRLKFQYDKILWWKQNWTISIRILLNASWTYIIIMHSYFSAKIWGQLHTTHNFLEYYEESSIPIIRGSEQGGI